MGSIGKFKVPIELQISVKQAAEEAAREQPLPESALDKGVAAINILKTEEERRYTLGLAYPALKEDVAVALDGHKDFIAPEALEKTAWEWMSKYRDINLFHRDGTDGHADVVESYIYRGPDWTIPHPSGGKPTVIKSGDWLLGAIWDDYGWTMVKAGLVNGWSPEGTARRVVPSADQLNRLRR